LAPATQRPSGDAFSMHFNERKLQHTCAWCHQAGDMSDGLYDDGEWMCGSCASGQSNDSANEIG
jgi:hypothetical protein